jgi:hypothetical protein
MIIVEKSNYVIFKSKDKFFNHVYIEKILDKMNLENKFICMIPVKKNSIKNFEIKLVELLREIKTKKEALGMKIYIIFINFQEAPSYKYNLKSFINYVSENLSIPINKMIIASGALHQLEEDIKNCPILTCAFGYHLRKIIFENIDLHLSPSHHFISLARIAKAHRVLATVEILDRNLNKFGYMSLGSGYYKNKPKTYPLIPIRYQHLIPMYIDGDIIGLDEKQYSNKNTKISHAFINLVMETSYDYEIEPDAWNVPFFTEKSAKPFIWGQVPLFVCCANSLGYLRNLGFDLFDDIIDHSYDFETNPNRRIIMVIKELEKICSQPIEYWQNYKRENISRFVKNSKIIIKLNIGMDKKIQQDLQFAIDK